MRRRLRVPVLGIAAGLATAGPAAAELPELRAGAWELGMNGALVSSGASGTASSLTLRSARIVAVGGARAALGAEVGYRHVGNIGDLDAVRVVAHGALHRTPDTTSAYPFLAVWGGLQHERVGSFGQTRFPLGVGAGLLSLVGPRAAVRIEYRFARVIDRDVAHFNEHELLTGITLLIGNGR